MNFFFLFDRVKPLKIVVKKLVSQLTVLISEGKGRMPQRHQMTGVTPQSGTFTAGGGEDVEVSAIPEGESTGKKKQNIL